MDNPNDSIVLILWRVRKRIPPGEGGRLNRVI